MTSPTNRTLLNVKIIGEGYDDNGARYIKFAVVGSKKDLPPYSMAQILKPEMLHTQLSNAGANIVTNAAKQALAELVQNYQPQEPSFRIVTRLGSFGSFFVLPNELIGKPTQKIEVSLGDLDVDMLNKYRCKGSLALWQEKIGALCQGNSRLMFAASLACTGPILCFVPGDRTGGFQIVGKAESGKTAAAMVAGSIWGCHTDAVRRSKGFVESWNTTPNQLEKTALAHSGTMFLLDETNLAGDDERQRANTIIKGLFLLSEGTKKGRYTEPAGQAWSGYFLGTSNLSLDQLAARGNVPIDDQHRGRLVDVVLPVSSGAYGIYEELHGFPDGARLTDALKRRCRSVFGSPSLELLRRIYRDRESREKAKTFVHRRRREYLASLKQITEVQGTKPLNRASARFATVYAAGSLAIMYGIFGWQRSDLLDAVLKCQLESLSAIAVKMLEPTADARAQLVDFLRLNRPELLNLNRKKLHRKAHEFGSAPGYCHQFKGKNWIYLTRDQLIEIVGSSSAAKRLKAALIQEKLMDGRNKGLVQRPIYIGRGNKGYERVHAIRMSILDD